MRVRVNANLKARSCDELVGQKKSMHVASFRFLLRELDLCLRGIVAATPGVEDRVVRDQAREWGELHKFPTVEGKLDMLVISILKQAQVVLDTHERRPALDYIDELTFRGLVHEMMDTRAHAESVLLTYLEEDGRTTIWSIMEGHTTLLEGHRRLVAKRSRDLAALPPGEARRAAAEKLCLLRGLVRERVGETNEAGEEPLARAAADNEVSEAAVALLLEAGWASGGEAMIDAAGRGRADGTMTLVAGGVPLESTNKEVWREAGSGGAMVWWEGPGGVGAPIL